MTFILAFAGKVFGVQIIPAASSILMATLGFLTGPLTYAILRKLGYCQLSSLVAMALYLGNGLILITSVGGMETPMVVFLMASSVYLLLTRR